MKIVLKWHLTLRMFIVIKISTRYLEKNNKEKLNIPFFLKLLTDSKIVERERETEIERDKCSPLFENIHLMLVVLDCDNTMNRFCIVESNEFK